MQSLDRSQADDDVLSSINIIPFVDIVLVLLIIFMLTSATIMKAGIEVDLPNAASAGTLVPSTLNFVLKKDGQLLIDGHPISKAEAARRVQEKKAADKKAQAVISADQGVPYGRVMELIDLVKLNGITTFALDVERVAAPAPPAP